MNSKFLTAVLFLFFANSISSFSQCETKEDPFSGKKEVSFDYKNKSIYFSSIDTNILLELKFNYNGELNQYIPEGKDINIKLENDIILNLKTISESSPVSSLVGQLIFSQYTFRMNLTKDELLKLSQSDAIFIRYPDINDSYLDLDLDKSAKKLKKNLRAGAECIAENQ